MKAEVVEGDLLAQEVEVIVNPWNRNLIPWWLLIPQGVSGAIKRRAGVAPFRELRAAGVLPLGGAAVTSAGRLPFRAIIHVAGINHWWRASQRSIRDSVRNAIALACERGFRSIALPLIGAGSGGMARSEVQSIIEDEIASLDYPLQVKLVVYGKGNGKRAQ
ncbi:MAG: macro domain-containing protein [Armatimonadota bacterium]